MRGRGAGPRSRALPSSLWTAAFELLCPPLPLKSCSGVEFTKSLPLNFPGFSHCLFASGLCIEILKRFNLGNTALDLWESVYLGSYECAHHFS